MRTVVLGATDIKMGAVGFGCAGLFRIPNPTQRRRALNRAFDLGFRHFDVAPMYGLGIAEKELGVLARRGRESMTITTKFGVAVTPLGRIAGLVQAPVRTLLRGNRSLEAAAKSSGSTPSSGLVGGLLYRDVRFNAEQAREALEQSLRALQTDYIDVFMLHQPPLTAGVLGPELVAFMDSERTRGTIRAWGVAGDYACKIDAIVDVFGEAPVLQFRDDATSDHMEPSTEVERATITFGALGRPLALLRSFVERYPHEVPEWSEVTGMDVADSANQCCALVEIALLRNGGGPVLVTTSTIQHLDILASLARASSPASEPQAVRGFSDLLASAQERLGYRGAAA
jgi:D-threo-aldose 1-dehydrogenase